MIHQKLSTQRIVVIAAPNGARHTSSDHAALPISPSELACCAHDLVEAGTAILHLHVRDERQRHSLDPAHYRAAIAAIRKAVGDRLVIQATTEAVGRYSAAEQMQMVRDLKPEAVSLALRELCRDEASEPEAAAFFAWLRREHIFPQYILYSREDLVRFDTLRQRGLFADDQPFCLLVIGKPSAGKSNEAQELGELLQVVDCTVFPWAACRFGAKEHDTMLEAAHAGGHVRIGFENNWSLPDGRIASDNAELIRTFTASISDSPRKIASAEEVRAAFF
jgi:uncharacterized protein (DUF849 family)